jgi:hypothetical protein
MSESPSRVGRLSESPPRVGSGSGSHYGTKIGRSVRVTLLEWAGVPSHPAPMSSEILLCYFFKLTLGMFIWSVQKPLTSKDILTLSFLVILSLLSFPFNSFLVLLSLFSFARFPFLCP